MIILQIPGLPPAPTTTTTPPAAQAPKSKNNDLPLFEELDKAEKEFDAISRGDKFLPLPAFDREQAKNDREIEAFINRVKAEPTVPPLPGISSSTGPTSTATYPKEDLEFQRIIARGHGFQSPGYSLVEVFNEDITRIKGYYVRPSAPEEKFFYLPNGQYLICKPNPTDSTKTTYEIGTISDDQRSMARVAYTLNQTSPLILGSNIISLHNLVPDGNGNFIREGEGNSGTYAFQYDGSMYYSGGKINGKETAAGIIKVNDPTKIDSQATPDDRSLLVKAFKLKPTLEGHWIYGDNRKCTFQADRKLKLEQTDTQPFIYSQLVIKDGKKVIQHLVYIKADNKYYPLHESQDHKYYFEEGGKFWIYHPGVPNGTWKPQSKL